MKNFLRQSKMLIGLTLATAPFVWLWVMSIVELGVWETLEVSAKYGAVMFVGIMVFVGLCLTFEEKK